MQSGARYPTDHNEQFIPLKVFTNWISSTCVYFIAKLYGRSQSLYICHLLIGISNLGKMVGLLLLVWVVRGGNHKCPALVCYFWLSQWVLPWCRMFSLHFFFFVFVFSSDLDTDDDLNSDDYEYEDEAKLVIFPDHYEIALPNIEELPALVSECARLLARCAWLSVSGVCACVVCVHAGAGGKTGWMSKEEKNEHKHERVASSLWKGLAGWGFSSVWPDSLCCKVFPLLCGPLSV